MSIESVQEGDVLVTLDGGTWSVQRVLKLDHEGAVVHLMVYPTMSTKPTIEEVRRSSPMVMHIPVMLSPGTLSGECIGNIPVEEGDLTGYTYYMEEVFGVHTNSKDEASDEMLEKMLESVSNAFKRANNHYEQKQYQEAIAAYNEVLELWPDYYEAIDNLGYVYMDIGQYDEAIALFKRSLAINSFGVTAHASLGDCHSQCGRYEEARLHYLDATRFEPEHRGLFKALNEVEKKLGLPLTKMQKKKSWWRFWN